jgi:hypothetical protein
MVQQTAAPETIIRKWHAHIKEYEYCKAYCRYVCEIFVNLSNKMHVNFLFLPWRKNIEKKQRKEKKKKKKRGHGGSRPSHHNHREMEALNPSMRGGWRRPTPLF